MNPGSTLSPIPNAAERNSSNFSPFQSVPVIAPTQTPPPPRRSDWPMPQYDPTVTAAVIDRIQATSSSSGETSSTGTNLSVIMSNNNHSHGPAPSSLDSRRNFRPRFDGESAPSSVQPGVLRVFTTYPGPMAGSFPSSTAPSSATTSSREVDERLSDFHAFIEEEQQGSTRNHPPPSDNRSGDWQRLAAAPPPNVNPFSGLSGRNRPSVIQMSHSGFPSGRLPFHQRIPPDTVPREERFYPDQMSVVNQQRSRMAAQEYIRDRARAPGAQVFPVIQPQQPGNYPANRGPPDTVSPAFLGNRFMARRPSDGGGGEQHRPQQPPPQDSPFVTVLHTSPGQALPVQGPVRNSRVRQLPTRQLPFLPLMTPSADNTPSGSDRTGPEGGAHWASTQPRPSQAQFSSFFSMVQNRSQDPGGAQTGAARPQVVRNVTTPYSRPFMVPSPEYMMRRNSGPLPSSTERLATPDSASFGMAGYGDHRQMREIQLHINAARPQPETVNVNGEQMPVHQTFSTRVSRNIPSHETLRALHDNNAEMRRRLVYMPQGQGSYGVTGRMAASLLQFMDAGIFMSNEHGEPKLILEEDVISAIECDTTSFRFENQFPATDECIICFEEFEQQQEVRVLSCNHTHRFHKHCIDKWLIKNKPNCPICRQILPTLDPKKEVIAHVMPIIEPALHSAGPSRGDRDSLNDPVMHWSPAYDHEMHDPDPRN